MKDSQKYRTLAYSLAVFFLLFNVGIPIVVAACPMIMDDDAGGICGSCFEFSNDGSEGFLPYRDTSCCSTTFASEANRVEFLKVSAVTVGGDDVFQFVGILPTQGIISQAFSYPASLATNTGPPTSNIPVLFSSLLI